MIRACSAIQSYAAQTMFHSTPTLSTDRSLPPSTRHLDQDTVSASSGSRNPMKDALKPMRAP